MDWKETYRRLNHQEPLAPDDERLERKLYINDFFGSVKQTLELNRGSNYKLLLSGHTGCGKSTFLNLLAQDPDIGQQFHVVNFSVKDLLDVNDIDHIDLLLSVAAQTITSLPEKKVRSVESLFDKAKTFAAQLQGLMVQEDAASSLHKDEAGAGVESKLGFFEFLKSRLFLRYRYEQERRTTVRERYRTRITELLSVIDSLLLEIQTLVRKPVLILIDDTDKMPPELGLKVFFDNGHHLAAPKANIVFVTDVSLSTSSRYPAIKAKFSGEEFFPAIKVIEKTGEESATTNENRQILAELIELRIPEALRDQETMNLAIEYSGGVVRELIRILQTAIFNAQGKIRTDNIEYARYRIANEFNLYGKHTRILRNVLQDPDWLAKEDTEIDEATLLEILHMPALFQYRNGDIKWYRPYPVFIDWLRGLGDTTPPKG